MESRRRESGLDSVINVWGLQPKGSESKPSERKNRRYIELRNVPAMEAANTPSSYETCQLWELQTTLHLGARRTRIKELRKTLDRLSISVGRVHGSTLHVQTSPVGSTIPFVKPRVRGQRVKGKQSTKHLGRWIISIVCKPCVKVSTRHSKAKESSRQSHLGRNPRPSIMFQCREITSKHSGHPARTDQ